MKIMNLIIITSILFWLCACSSNIFIGKKYSSMKELFEHNYVITNLEMREKTDLVGQILKNPNNAKTIIIESKFYETAMFNKFQSKDFSNAIDFIIKNKDSLIIKNKCEAIFSRNCNGEQCIDSCKFSHNIAYTVPNKPYMIIFEFKFCKTQWRLYDINISGEEYLFCD